MAVGFDEDLDVDGPDLALWKGGFGASGSATHMQGDADEDHEASDYNNNGPDLTNWKAGFGLCAGATHMQGDADGDGRVDGDDFLAWQRAIGERECDGKFFACA